MIATHKESKLGAIREAYSIAFSRILLARVNNKIKPILVCTDEELESMKKANNMEPLFLNPLKAK